MQSSGFSEVAWCIRSVNGTLRTVPYNEFTTMNKMIVKKMQYDSPEFKESNLWIVERTPEDLCREIYATRKLAMQLSAGEYDIEQPLNKNVVKKIYL